MATKRTLLTQISDELDVPLRQAQEIVQRFMNGIIETLEHEGRMELRNFGVFQVKKRKARNARNPRTGEGVPVPERNVVVFKPGLEMAERIARLVSAPQGNE